MHILYSSKKVMYLCDRLTLRYKYLEYLFETEKIYFELYSTLHNEIKADYSTL